MIVLLTCTCHRCRLHRVTHIDPLASVHKMDLLLEAAASPMSMRATRHLRALKGQRLSADDSGSQMEAVRHRHIDKTDKRQRSASTASTAVKGHKPIKTPSPSTEWPTTGLFSCAHCEMCALIVLSLSHHSVCCATSLAQLPDRSCACVRYWHMCRLVPRRTFPTKRLRASHQFTHMKTRAARKFVCTLCPSGALPCHDWVDRYVMMWF